MRLGMVGLGRMGGNMTIRLIRFGHDVVAFDPNPEARQLVGRPGRNRPRDSRASWPSWSPPGSSGSWCPPEK